MKRLSASKGFTLIELLVVVVLLGILSAFAYGAFQNYSGSASTNVNNYLLGTVTGAVATCSALGQGTCASPLSTLLPNFGGGTIVNATGKTDPGGTVTNGDCTITVSAGGAVTKGGGC